MGSKEMSRKLFTDQLSWDRDGSAAQEYVGGKASSLEDEVVC